MKRIVVYCAVCLVMSVTSAAAEYGEAVRISAGPLLMYDPFDQEAGSGGQLTLDYPVKKGLELELYGAMSNHFSAGNDLTDGDVAVFMVTLGGRYLLQTRGNGTGFLAVGAGPMEMDAEESPAGDSDNRHGGAARFAVGLDYQFTPRLGVRLGAGFVRGLGATDEVTLFDLSTSLFFAL